jgi:hypothetical protein
MSNIIIYTTDDGAAKIELRLEKGTVWLSQAEIAELFQTTKQNISKHIQAIFDDHELEKATVNYQLTVQNEGEREVSRISHKQAEEKAKIEYRKYKTKTLEAVEQEYLNAIKTLENQAKTESKKKRNKE